MEVSGSKLVVVTRDLKHADARLHFGQRCEGALGAALGCLCGSQIRARLAVEKACPLTRHRVLVFESGPTSIANRASKNASDRTDGLLCVEAALLEVHVEMLACAVRQIGRKLLHLEVFGARLEDGIDGCDGRRGEGESLLHGRTMTCAE